MLPENRRSMQEKYLFNCLMFEIVKILNNLSESYQVQHVRVYILVLKN